MSNFVGVRLGLRLTAALMLAAAMLVVVNPAVMAQGKDKDDDNDGPVISKETGQEAASGDVETEIEIKNEGDNSNVCVALLQSANTGNLQNAQGAAQYGSKGGDIEVEGGEFSISPELEAECEQTIEQTATATSPAPPPPPAPPAPRPTPTPAPTPAPAPAPSVAAASAPAKELPRTGGVVGTSLLTLGAGILLVGGGLLTRRIVR